MHVLKSRVFTKGYEKEKWVNSYTILEVEEAFLGLLPRAESTDQVTATYNYKDMWYIYIQKNVNEITAN